MSLVGSVQLRSARFRSPDCSAMGRSSARRRLSVRVSGYHLGSGAVRARRAVVTREYSRAPSNSPPMFATRGGGIFLLCWSPPKRGGGRTANSPPDPSVVAVALARRRRRRDFRSKEHKRRGAHEGSKARCKWHKNSANHDKCAFPGRRSERREKRARTDTGVLRPTLSKNIVMNET